jgi:NTP pyrophosphatase (non-canonical NTP hydrolase)
MPELPQAASLAQFQTYVRELEAERGFTGNTVEQTSLLLGEEIGELFKAIRKQQKMAVDANSRVGNVDEELADVLIYLLALANRFGIDLEDAFRKKEEINKNRQWRPAAPADDPHGTGSSDG